MLNKKSIKKIRIKHENIVQFMEIFIVINYMLFFSIFFKISYYYFVTPFLAKTPIPDFLGLIDIKYWIVGTLVFAIFITEYVSKGRIWLVKLKDIDGIPSYTKYLEYYSWLLPKFLANLGLFFIILFVFNVYFFLIGLLFLGTSLVLYLVIYLMIGGNNYKYNLYYNINRAYNIFEDYMNNVNDMEKNLLSYEFNKYFKRSLFIIDIILLKGVKLDDLKKNNDESLKNFIQYYLPAYIKYSNKEQLASFRNHLIEIMKLIDKNNNVPLKITLLLSDISRDLETFLELNNYSTTGQNWHIKMPSWVNFIGVSFISIKSTSKGSMIVILLIILLISAIASIIISLVPFIEGVSKLITLVR